MTALHGQKVWKRMQWILQSWPHWSKSIYTKSGLAQNMFVLILSQSGEASRAMLGSGFARLIVTSLGTAYIRRSPAAAWRYIDDEECNFSTDVNRHTLLFMVWRSPTPTLSARLQILLPSHIFTACASRCAYTTIILCCRWMIYLITTAMKSSICNTSG